MAEIIQVKSPVKAVITDRISYLKARSEIEQLSQKHGLNVADMPRLIQAITNDSDIRSIVRPGKWLDVISGEYHGTREGKRSYEVWHSAGSLSTLEGLKKGRKDVKQYGFMPVDPNEWELIGMGKYNGDVVERVHLDDLRKGNNIPEAGTPYTTFALIDKDDITINPRDQLDYDTFMTDDRVLMIAGSPDNRADVAKMLFKDESRSSIGSYHRINEVGFDNSRGRLVCLDDNYYGLYGCDYVGSSGRFLGVSDGVASIGDATQKIATHQKQTPESLEGKIMITPGQDFEIKGITYRENNGVYMPIIKGE